MQKLPEIRRAPLSTEQRTHRAEAEQLRADARAERARKQREDAAQREAAGWAKIAADERVEQMLIEASREGRAWVQGLLGDDGGGR